MKQKLFNLGLAVAVMITSGLVSAEDFKGSPRPHEVTLGVSTGLGLVGSTPGLILQALVAKKIVDHGFVEDINNQVFGELGLGIVFHEGGSSGFYTTHIRWDFLKDDDWTVFGIGGFGGNAVSSGLGGTTITFFPRFGVGAFYYFSNEVALRLDASHESSTVGVSFSI